MHPFDIAAANPCPLCSRVPKCPRAMEPEHDCLELWPLGQPSRRELYAVFEFQTENHQIALANPAVSGMASRWREGQPVAHARRPAAVRENTACHCAAEAAHFMPYPPYGGLCCGV